MNNRELKQFKMVEGLSDDVVRVMINTVRFWSYNCYCFVVLKQSYGLCYCTSGLYRHARRVDQKGAQSVQIELQLSCPHSSK